VPTHRLHDATGDDLGLMEHPAPNVEPGDVVMLDDGRAVLVTARVETDRGQFAATRHAAFTKHHIAQDMFKRLRGTGPLTPRHPQT